MNRKSLLAMAAGCALLVPLCLAQGGSDADAVAKGKAVFEQCSICHNADSDEKKMGPGLKGLFKKETLSDGKTKATEANIRKKINEGGNGMPAFDQMLENGEKDQLIAYLKTL